MSDPIDITSIIADVITVSPLAGVLLLIWWDTRKEFRAERDARTLELKDFAKSGTDVALKSAEAMSHQAQANDRQTVVMNSLAERMSRIEAKLDGKN